MNEHTNTNEKQYLIDLMNDTGYIVDDIYDALKRASHVADVFNINKAHDPRFMLSWGESSETLIELNRAFLDTHNIPIKLMGGVLTRLTDAIAQYNVSNDYVIIADRSRAIDSASHDIAVFHELIHATGAQNRLARAMGGVNMTPSKYTRARVDYEETIAAIAEYIIALALGINCYVTDSIRMRIVTYCARSIPDTDALKDAVDAAESAIAYMLESAYFAS